jgi:hypothetical protein
MSCLNRTWIGPPNTSRRYFGHQITWYCTENTALRVDRHCTNHTINRTTDNGPLTRRKQTGSAIPQLKPRARAKENYGQIAADAQEPVAQQTRAVAASMAKA